MPRSLPSLRPRWPWSSCRRRRFDARRHRAGSCAGARAPTAPSLAQYAGLAWRNIGPSRGGRSTAVAGVPGQPLTYFAGYTGGGLWRTDNAGISWRNISDGFFTTGSIGAIAVAPSDHNVIYVGTGEHAIRGQSSTYGDGVYKSTDMGRTWTNVGLERHAADLGGARAPRRIPTSCTSRRRATAGRARRRAASTAAPTAARRGRSCSRARTPPVAPADLSMDPTNPRILYAAFWDHQRTPWNVRSGGPGSGIWKSTDGGDSWTRLAQGLPSLMGKIGVAVSPANPDRVFAIVEAEEGGLFRSDDARPYRGACCRATGSSRRARGTT